MKKHSLTKGVLLAFALMMTNMVCGQDYTQKCLQVVETDGTQTNFALSEKPQITIVDNEMVFTSSSLTLSVPFDGFVEYKFVEDVPNKIDNTSADNSMDIASGKVYITGLKAGAKVYVYTVDGQEMLSQSASESGSVTIDLTKLKNGVTYVLRTSTVSYKIMNR